MGAEEKARKDMLELIGERLGPVLRAGKYDAGCPACGCEQPGAIQKQFHGGFDERDQNDLCRVRGEHQHGRCAACGYGWLEQVRDAEAEDRRRPASEVGVTMHTPLPKLSLVGKAGEA